jgi:hypothetical protein
MVVGSTDRCAAPRHLDEKHHTQGPPQQAGIRDMNHPMRKLISRGELELLPVACRRSLPFSRGLFSLHTSRMSFINSSSQESVSLTWEIAIGVVVQAVLKAEHPVLNIAGTLLRRRDHSGGRLNTRAQSPCLRDTSKVR